MPSYACSIIRAEVVANQRTPKKGEGFPYEIVRKRPSPYGRACTPPLAVIPPVQIRVDQCSSVVTGFCLIWSPFVLFGAVRS